jgi:hypothetical protein
VIRVVLDTNVFVSALIRRHGKPDQIYRLAGDKFQLVTREFILSELAETLTRERIRTKYQQETMLERRAGFIATIRIMADLVSPHTKLTVVSDTQDNPVLACAVDGLAEYLVTGDRRLLELGAYGPVQIVTPHTFLEILQSQ